MHVTVDPIPVNVQGGGALANDIADAVANRLEGKIKSGVGSVTDLDPFAAKHKAWSKSSNPFLKHWAT